MVASVCFVLTTRGDSDNRLSPVLLDELIEMNIENRLKAKYPNLDDYFKVKNKLDNLVEENLRKKGLRESEKRRKKERELERKRQEEQKLAQLANIKNKVQEDSGQWKVFQVTAYTNDVESTGKNSKHPLYGITANGEKTQEGRTLSCPPEYPFGTRMYIPYFDNTFTCVDRGSAIVGNRLDVYIKDINRALEFGRRNLEVKILITKE